MSGLKAGLLPVIAAVAGACLAVEGVRIKHMAELQSPELKVREKAAEDIRQERAELIKELIKLAGQKVEPLPSSDPRFVEYPWHDSKHLAMLVLGDIRASEAIPVLLENLDYKNPRSIMTEYLGKESWYPAVEALSKIGMPAIGPVIGKLGEYEKDGLGRELCCWIIKDVLGERLGRVRLEMAIEEEKKAAVRKNLRAAMSKYFAKPEISKDKIRVLEE